MRSTSCTEGPAAAVETEMRSLMVRSGVAGVWTPEKKSSSLSAVEGVSGTPLMESWGAVPSES